MKGWPCNPLNYQSVAFYIKNPFYDPKFQVLWNKNFHLFLNPIFGMMALILPIFRSFDKNITWLLFRHLDGGKKTLPLIIRFNFRHVPVGKSSFPIDFKCGCAVSVYLQQTLKINERSSKQNFII